MKVFVLLVDVIVGIFMLYFVLWLFVLVISIFDENKFVFWWGDSVLCLVFLGVKKCRLVNIFSVVVILYLRDCFSVLC